MEKEFVPYEIALALKELGFDKPCCGYYKTIDKKQILFLSEVNKNIALEHGVIYKLKAPLFQQVFRWFREKCNLNFTIITNYAKVNSKIIKSYRVGIIVVKNKIIDSYFLRPENDKLSFIEFTTYEEAELECLKKLIEIVKTNDY